MSSDLPPLSLDVLTTPGGGEPLLFRDGNLTPRDGQATYPVRNGIVYLLPAELRNANTKEAEKEAWTQVSRKNAWSFSTSDILSFPHGSDDPYWRKVVASMDYVSAALPDPSGLRGLDLACGTGWATAWLARRGARMIAADFNDTPHNGLGAAVRLREEGIEFDAVCCDAEEIPVADASLDFVFICSALHHFTRPDMTLAEVSRILKPGGIVLNLCESFRCFWQRPGYAAPGTLRAEYIETGINEDNHTQRQYEKYYAGAGLQLTTLLPAWDHPDRAAKPEDWVNTGFEHRRGEHPSALVRTALSILPKALVMPAIRWRLLHATTRDRTFIARKPERHPLP